VNHPYFGILGENNDTWFKRKLFFKTAALYYKRCKCETVLTQILDMPCYFF